MFYVTLNLPENFRSIPAGAARLQSNGAAHGAVIAYSDEKRKLGEETSYYISSEGGL